MAEELTARMIQRGFRTAADANNAVFTVKHIGTKRGRAVLAWRDVVRAKAERTEPTSITPAEDQAIRARFEARRAALVAQRGSVQGSLPAAEQAIRTTHSQTLARLDQQETAEHRESVAKKDRARTHAQAVVGDATWKLEHLSRERQPPPVVESRRRCAEARLQQAAANWRKTRLEHQVAVGRAGLTRWRYLKRVLGMA